MVKKIKRKPIEYIKIVIVIVCLIAIAAGLAVLFYYLVSVKNVIDYDAYIIVSDRIGFDVSKDYIHFGMVMPGGSSSKRIALSNNYNVPLKIQAKVSGDLRGWITFDMENGMLIGSGENKTLFANIVVPQAAPYGNYSGHVKLIFRRF